MKTASAYQLLTTQEKQFLSDISKDIAMLVSEREKMDYFRKQLTEFSDKWKAYKKAYDADRKGKWQPSMGKPSDPLGTIWPIVYGDGWRNSANFSYNPRNLMQLLPCIRDVRTVLGAYALLAVIHDKVLPNCPPIAKNVFPKELTSEIWRNLVTGVDLEGQRIRVIWRRKDKIQGCLRNVKKDLMPELEAKLLQKSPRLRQPIEDNQAKRFSEDDERILTRSKTSGKKADIASEQQKDEQDSGGLTKAERQAYQSYEYVISKEPKLAEVKDDDIYNWLKENGFPEYELPSRDTWKRYVRQGRKACGTQKNNPRKGRTGRSIVGVGQIEYTSSQRRD